MVRDTGEKHYDKKEIIDDLQRCGYTLLLDFEIMNVPNIVNITYGRDVGYKIEQEHFDKEIENISATDIRKTRN